MRLVVPCLQVPCPYHETACLVCVVFASKYGLCLTSLKSISKEVCCQLVLFCCLGKLVVFMFFLVLLQLWVWLIFLVSPVSGRPLAACGVWWCGIAELDHPSCFPTQSDTSGKCMLRELETWGLGTVAVSGGYGAGDWGWTLTEPKSVLWICYLGW